MNGLEPPDTHHLRAAQGWLELGNPAEAKAELAGISPALRHHPDVLETCWSVQAAVRDWQGCLETAAALMKAAPRRPSGWVHRSFALHELKRTKEAADMLFPAVERFPKDWLIRYNLACYACQLGNPSEAWDWLQNAFELGHEPEIRKMALEDADLKPLRPKLGKSGAPF